MNATASAVDLALANAAQGWSVFPCLPDSEGTRKAKEPYVDWTEVASTDPERISKWWRIWPRALVGIRLPEGITVVDIDHHDDRDGLALADDNGWPTEARISGVSTSGAGLHLWYSGTSRNVPVVSGFIDRKSAGGYVVASYPLPSPETITEPLPEPYQGTPTPRVNADPAALEWLSDGEPTAYVQTWIDSLPAELHGDDSLASFAAEISTLTYAGHSGTRAAFDALVDLWETTEHASPNPDWPARSMAYMLTANRPPWLDEATQEIQELIEPDEDDLLPLISVADLRARPRPVWLIRNLIQEGTVSVLAGEPGLGKSFLSIDIASCLATGMAFHGQVVRQTRTVYVVGEGLGGIADRIDAWALAHRQDPEDGLAFIEDGVNLSDPASIERLGRTMLTRGFGLVILDTLSQLSDLDDENAASQVARVLKQAAILSKLGLTVLIVHHTNKSEKGKVRGSSAIRGNVDTVIVARGTSDGFKLSTERADDGKQRNGEPIRWEGFTLRQSGPSAVVHREISHDPIGDAIDAVLLDNAEHSVNEILMRLGERSDAMRLRVQRRLKELEQAGTVTADGATRNRTYRAAQPF